MDSDAEVEFDRVVVSEDGQSRSLTVDQFTSLPLESRVELIISDALRFFRGPVVVDPTRALRWLRHRRRLAM